MKNTWQKYLNYHSEWGQIIIVFNKSFFGIFEAEMNRYNSNGQLTLIFMLIILTGLVLRCWHVLEIPFTFDELSAMSRTQFNSFSDVIRVGVVEKDSHPAGVQVFLYYWVMSFGEREVIVKLPFILFGLISIYLVYKIGKLWFGDTAGILSAALMSSLQLFVMYSQIARPYVSGLFFTLAATLLWSKYFFNAPKKKYLFGFVIFSALSAYNHYFSLLFVAVMGISGLFIIKRKNLLAYLLSGVAILILFIPHLPIILSQAEKGSIGGWLGTPGPYFLLDFVYWLFHESYLVISIFILLLLIGRSVFKENEVSRINISGKRWLLFLWLLPAPLFGYIYSYVKEPILQYSLLIFTTPYLFLFVFSFVGEWKKQYLTIAVILILASNTITLIFNKDYYRHFYRQPFDQMVKNAIHIEKENEKGVFIINDYIPYYSEYYFRKYKKHLPYYTTRNKEVSVSGFKKMLSEIKQDIVITSGLADEYFQLILEEFPNWEAYETGFTYEQYVFSKQPISGRQPMNRQTLSELTFNNNTEGAWAYNNKNVVFDSILENYQYLMQPDELYGPMLEWPLDSISGDIYFIVDAELEIVSQSTDLNAVLVSEIKRKNALLHWQGADFSDFQVKKEKLQKVFLTMDIQKSLSNRNKIDNQTLRFYIWNRGQQEFKLNKISIYVRPGNPGRYRL